MNMFIFLESIHCNRFVASNSYTYVLFQLDVLFKVDIVDNYIVNIHYKNEYPT